MSSTNMEKAIREYNRKVMPFTSDNYRVYVRKDFVGGWELINVTEVDDWAEELGWRDLHMSLQRFAVNEEVTDDSLRFMDLIIELDDAKTKGQTALEETRRLISWFTQFSPRDGDLRVWFSGNKGFHIIISGISLGLFPAKDIHVVASFVAGKICDEVGITTADYQMYSKKKTIRLPNSRHTNPYKRTEDGPQFLYKVELSHEQVMKFSITDIHYYAQGQRKPLFTQAEVDANGPNQNIAPLMGRIHGEYEKMKMEVESVEKKLKFTGDLKGKIPICIKDILNYNFSKYQRRNKAMLSLIAFFKDSGRPQDEVIKIVSDWTSGIPWDTQKERERMAQVRPATVVAFNADGDGYDFSCRKCQSINKGIAKDEPIVRCKGSACPFIEDPLEQGVTSDVVIDIDLLEKIAAVKDNTKYRSSCYVDAYEQKTYNVPRIVRGSCPYNPHEPKTHEDICTFCSMPHTADNKDQTPEEAEPLVLERRVLGHKGHALDFVDVKKSRVKGLILETFGVPKECPQFKYTIPVMQKLMQLLISSPKKIENSYSAEETENKGKEVNCHHAFMVVKDEDTKLPEEGEHVTTNVSVVTDAKDQSSCFFLYNWRSEVDFIDAFSMSKDLHDRLHEAHAVKQTETLEEKIALRAENMGRVCGLVGMEDLLIMLDIIYHSPLTIKIGNKEDRGFSHGIIIGDPGQGKSSAMLGLSRHYDLGAIEDGGNSRRTGLLYTIDNNRKFGARVVWGSITRLDRQLIAIEEFNQLPRDTLEKMTQVRSSGIIRVSGQATGSARARTRMVLIGNPPSASGRLNNYSYGIDAIRHAIKKSQDLRRFDLAIVLRSKDEMTAEMWAKSISTEGPDPAYSSFMCQNLILWAWTRKKDQVKWDDTAVKVLQEESAKISEYFRCDVALVEPKDMAMRLGRIAQGIAAMAYSSSENGELLWIMPEHVRYAASFFTKLMTRVGDMDLDIYASVWREMNILTNEQERWLEGTLRIQSWFQTFCRSMMAADTFTERTVKQLIDSDNDSKNMFYNNLIGSGMLTQPPGKINLVRSPKFIAWLRTHMQKLIGKLEAPKVYDPHGGDTIAEEVEGELEMYIEEGDTHQEF